MASVELRLWLVGKQSGWVQIGRGSCLIYVWAFSVRDEKFKSSSIAVVTPVISGDRADCVVEDALSKLARELQLPFVKCHCIQSFFICLLKRYEL